MVQIFVNASSCVKSGSSTLCVNTDCPLTIRELSIVVSEKLGIPTDELNFFSRKSKLHHDHALIDGQTVHLLFELKGGKGGFGSMLRAIGAQIEKTTNKEACRDLSGRRLRDINEEKRLKKWIAKQAEREREKLERKRLRLERMLAQPKHEFHDPSYDQHRSALTENINDALSQGLSNAASSSKRKAPEPSTQPRKKLWLGTEGFNLDEGSSSSGSDRSSEDDSSSENSKDSFDFKSLSMSEQMEVLKEIKHKLEEGTEAEQKSSEDSAEESGKTEEPSTSDQDPSSSQIFVEESGKIKEPSKSQKEPPSNTVTSEVRAVTSSNERVTLSLEGSDRRSSRSNNTDDIKAPEEIPSSTASSDSQPVSSTATEGIKQEINLNDYKSVEELEALGLEALKTALVDLGVKCGGTLRQRAERMFSIKGLEREKIPSSLLAKPSRSEK